MEAIVQGAFVHTDMDIERLKSPASGFSTNGSASSDYNSNASERMNAFSSSSASDTSTLFSDACSFSNREVTPNSKPAPEVASDSASSTMSQSTPVIPQEEFLNDTEFLQYIDPAPRRPPSYKVANPNRSVRYPVYDTCHAPCSKDELPPSYSSAVYHYTIIALKSEYISPYEPATARQWQNFIMEINSTQLNFYHIEPSLTARIKNYSSGCASSGTTSPLEGGKLFGFGNKPVAYNFTKYDQERVCYTIQRNRSAFLTEENLYKSFSLQFAKFGIPIDYNKRTFVLRMRCETEQFLINFAHVDDMISWTTYLSMGICVSLDLEIRPMPDYRIVPRRRRRHHGHGRHGRRSYYANGHGMGVSSRRSSVSAVRRTRDIMSSHISDAKASLMTDSRKSSNNSTTGSLSASSSSLAGLGIEIQSRRDSMPTPYSTSPTSIQSSSSLANIARIKSNPQPTLKSKIKGLFKLGYTPKTVAPRNIPSSPNSFGSQLNREVSPTSSTPSSPVLNAMTFSTVTSLNSLMEDEDENESEEDASLPGGMQFSRNHTSRMRSCSSPMFHATQMRMLSPQNSDLTGMFSKDIAKHSATGHYEFQNKMVQRNSIILQHELEELQEVIREHQESDDDEEEDDEDDTFDEMNDSTVSASQINNFARLNSVYSDEGIFHDTDNEEHDYHMNYRRRASSMLSTLSYAALGDDEVKWCPPVKDVSRRRQIRNALRCIRPFLEDNEWVGLVCFRPTECPPYGTNNNPIWYARKPNNKKTRNSIQSMHHPVDFNCIKNHSLDSFVVGPSDFLKADTKTVRLISKAKTKKSKDDDIEVHGTQAQDN
ncbi:hypothetical protein DAKH74_022490 [Maudiozyma humilis]|uniref:PH domain-containing protein n=1 Tax=Maudiozyma humilis TaxID=51915 RepID=A0AAV5RYF1_MAUHU|nr:hypothetical protein DAKH74_022490 [Kazachstania humilis]